ncbi:MAG: UPF0149 family protein [Novosphingobium sp.]
MDSLPPYLEELDKLLLEMPDDTMLLSQMDGFLTGIIVSPDMIMPKKWLKIIWAGEDGEGAPEFGDAATLKRFIDLVMLHYNQILGSLNRPGDFAPVFEMDTRSDETLWELWIEGFAQAMELSPEGWRRISASGDPACKDALAGIATLKDFYEGELKLAKAEEDRWDREAPDLIPIWVELLHAWRLVNECRRPTPVRYTKVGRNDPCSCGSGKKYKKCCGLN